MVTTPSLFDEIIKWTRVSPPVTGDRVKLFFYRLEIEFEAGVGLATGQGSDPPLYR